MLNPCVLLIDDDSESALSLSRALQGQSIGVPVHFAANAERALEIFTSERPAVVVLDLHLNERSGVESGFAVLRALQRISRACRVIVLTGHGAAEYGVRALSLGAANFLQKPASVPHLAALILDGMQQAALRAELEVLRTRDREALGIGIAGVGEKTKELIAKIHYASQTSQSVLLTGETGTGKGLCARSIHHLSNRRACPFVRYQPSYLTADLVNSELFGHMKGSFTGATQTRKGLLAEAGEGTLFLDEIDELPQESQVALLGVLQEKKYRVIGDNREHGARFRVIAASNQDLEGCMRNGKLRKDLYHRVAHFCIHVPSLRERKEDILPLVTYQLHSVHLREELPLLEVSPEAEKVLVLRDWPGNVRELFAVVEGAGHHAVYCGRSRIEPEDLFFNDARPPSAEQGFHERVEAFKVKIIEEALVRSGGNQVKASGELGLDRKSLRRILARQ